MKLLTLLCAGVSILTVSCASTKQTTMPKTPLYETKWALKKIHTDSGIEDVQTKAFIKFDEAKQSAGGNGSCNNFGSSFTINNDEIAFKNIFSTKMYCEAVQKTENSFLHQLEKATRFEITGNSLALLRDKEVLLEFVSE